MVLNNKAQMMLVGIMIALMSLFIVIAFLGPLKGIVDEARDSNHLNCASAPDYNSSKVSEYLTCVAVDLTIPYFVITCLIVGIGLIGWARVRRV